MEGVCFNFENTQENNLELSYQNDSIEFMGVGGDWDQMGDESTIEMLQDFKFSEEQCQEQYEMLRSDNQNQKYTDCKQQFPVQQHPTIQQQTLANSQHSKKPSLGLKLTSSGQNFLSQVKTNTIKLFSKQSIITEESMSQCQTSYEPSMQIKNLSTLKIDNSAINNNLFNQQSASFNKSYFNQSISRQNLSNSIINQTQNNQIQQCNDHGQLQQNQNQTIPVQSSQQDQNKPINSYQDSKDIKLSDECQNDSMALTANFNTNPKQINLIQNENNKSGTIALPFFRRLQNQSQNFNDQTQSLRQLNFIGKSPIDFYGNITQKQTFTQASTASLYSSNLNFQTKPLQESKNIQILNYYTQTLNQSNQYRARNLLSSCPKAKLIWISSQNDKTKKFDLTKIVSKSNIRIIKNDSLQDKENQGINEKVEKAQTLLNKEKSPITLKLKKCQITDKTNSQSTNIKVKPVQIVSNKNYSSLRQNLENPMKQDQQDYNEFLQEEQQIMRQMEKDLKCNLKFGEKSLVSPNAVIYRPKSTQPIHRKSYSFNSPHLLGGFLRQFNQQQKIKRQSLGQNEEYQIQEDMPSIIDESSLMIENDPSFMQLEDQSFVLANRYAI
eukprot:403340512